MSDLATPPKRRPFVGRGGCIRVVRAHSYAPHIAHDPRRLAILCDTPNVPDDVRHVLTRITSMDGRRDRSVASPPKPSLSPALTHARTIRLA